MSIFGKHKEKGQHLSINEVNMIFFNALDTKGKQILVHFRTMCFKKTAPPKRQNVNKDKIKLLVYQFNAKTG